MKNPSIAENYRTLINQINEAETQSGREPHSVQLLAVSKTHASDKLREAYAAGARHFGENYVQEALDKIAELSAPGTSTPGITWHFIGPIQSNKTRDIAGAFDWVHSVDRLKIAQRLNDQRPDGLSPLNVCVQVNLSHEDTKAGVDIGDAEVLCTQITQHMPHLKLRGLMAIPAPSADVHAQRATFRPLHDLFVQLRERFPSMDTLSIGMTDDFPAAIAEGSTMIRVGTAIFGAREYPPSRDGSPV